MSSDRVESFKARMADERDHEASNAAHQQLADAIAETREIQNELAAIQQSPRVRRGRRLGGMSFGAVEMQKRLNVALAREQAARENYRRALDGE